MGTVPYVLAAGLWLGVAGWYEDHVTDRVHSLIKATVDSGGDVGELRANWTQGLGPCFVAALNASLALIAFLMAVISVAWWVADAIVGPLDVGSDGVAALLGAVVAGVAVAGPIHVFNRVSAYPIEELDRAVVVHAVEGVRLSQEELTAAIERSHEELLTAVESVSSVRQQPSLLRRLLGRR